MKFSIATIGKYVPLLAILYSVWQAYGQRGIGGLKQDLADLPNLITYKEDLMKLAVGVVIIVAGSIVVRKFVPGGIIRYILIAVVYVSGTSMILDAVKAGRSGSISFFQGAPAKAPAAQSSLQGMN